MSRSIITGLLSGAAALSLTILSGCYLEQGKLYFDELNLDPITVYQMAPLETTVYCLAEGDLPAGRKLRELHEQELSALERQPEQANWGKLVCLALAEAATAEQLKETRNALQLVIAVNRRYANPARGFKRLIEQRLKSLEAFAQLEAEQAEARRRCRGDLDERRTATDACREQLAAERERVRALMQKVEKLKEIELLLHPKTET